MALPCGPLRPKRLRRILSGVVHSFRLTRRDERIVVTLNGRDNTGQFVTQEVVAGSLSTSGALLSGISREMRPGDLIWVEHAGTKAHLKIVWVRDSESHHLIQAAVHLVKQERYPWAKS